MTDIDVCGSRNTTFDSRELTNILRLLLSIKDATHTKNQQEFLHFSTQIFHLPSLMVHLDTSISLMLPMHGFL